MTIKKRNETKWKKNTYIGKRKFNSQIYHVNSDGLWAIVGTLVQRIDAAQCWYICINFEIHAAGWEWERDFTIWAVHPLICSAFISKCIDERRTTILFVLFCYRFPLELFCVIKHNVLIGINVYVCPCVCHFSIHCWNILMSFVIWHQHFGTGSHWFSGFDTWSDRFIIIFIHSMCNSMYNCTFVSSKMMNEQRPNDV